MEVFNKTTFGNANYLAGLFNKYGYEKHENLAILAMGNPKVLSRNEMFQLGIILTELKQREDPVIINGIIENIFANL
jgi:hypothetical protein